MWDDSCREAMEKEGKGGEKGKRPSFVGQMSSGHFRLTSASSTDGKSRPVFLSQEEGTR